MAGVWESSYLTCPTWFERCAFKGTNCSVVKFQLSTRRPRTARCPSGSPAVWVNFSVFDCFLVVFLSEVRKTKFLNEAVKQQQQEEEERAVCGVVRGYRIWDRLTFITRRTAASLGQSWASRTDSFTEEDVELELFKGRGKGRKYQAGGGKFIFFSQDCELLDYWL